MQVARLLGTRLHILEVSRLLHLEDHKSGLREIIVQGVVVLPLRFLVNANGVYSLLGNAHSDVA